MSPHASRGGCQRSWVPFAVLAVVVAVVLAPAPTARAQCTTIDFNNLAPGTVVTNQYDGVTFSARMPAGGAGPDPIIYNPNGSTTSEPYCLSAKGDALGEFSEEYLRLDFARDQTEVTFNLGVRVGCADDDTVQVRYYEYSGGSYILRGTQNVPVNGTLTTERVLVFVRVTRAAGFRRVEIEGGPAGGCAARFELIDDLAFDIDLTAPVAEISSPGGLGCVCYGDTIYGSAYDPDGGIQGWVLERKAPDAANWTLITTSTTEIIDAALSNWYPSASQGFYILRLTVTNECELETTATTVVWLNRVFDTLEFRSPADGAVVGGTVCIDGTAWDQYCTGELAVEYLRVGTGTWYPCDVVNPPWIANDPLGSWNTRDGEKDGDYDIRVTATDSCDNVATATHTVTLDNTLPVALITSPTDCTHVSGIVPVYGTANDANLAGWVLQYSGDGSHTWSTIASGNTPKVNQFLGNWNTTGLDVCAYVLRLVVTDQAVLDCDGALHNQKEFVLCVDVGSSCDVNGDGSVNGFDIDPFVECLMGG
ncbi:MAG: hypothetical protein CHACPFDD_01735 [Phycisphaerae bacterium]|nr:hypothetical protein [Phycisphaerae bacterium]